MKILSSLLFAFALAAQTKAPTAITLAQIGAPPGIAPMILMAAPSIGGLSLTYVAIDPAAFVLDTTTNPFTLRAAAPSPLPVFVDAETPAGVIDGKNAGFTLAFVPAPAASLHIYRNGLLVSAGSDYSPAGGAIAFAAGAIPQPGDSLQASYRH